MPPLPANLLLKLDQLASEFDQLGAELQDPQVLADHEQVRALSVKRAAMADMVEQYRRQQALQRQIRENEQLIAEAADPELAELAQAELPVLRQQAEQLLEQIASDLVTAEDRVVGSVMLEVRAGTGGAEAALWAGDLLAMYQKFAARKGWDFTLLSVSEGEQGGLRQAIASVRGQGVWQALGYEGGVHCVKRVPATETQGRIHTSTATVAVLPEPEKVQLNIPEDEVQVHVTTAQGPGGQNVNKVATAVHLVHKPTGIEVRMQESKSQHQNRDRAWKLLRARVYDHYQKQKDAARDKARSDMIGSGERSERIRTYRWKESIAVDHRINFTLPLQAAMDGNLDPLLEALLAEDRTRRLAAL